MLDNIPILSLITFSPLLGILILICMPSSAGRWLKIVGIGATFIPLALATWVYIDYLAQGGGFEYREITDWIRIALNKEFFGTPVSAFQIEFQYHLAADGLALPLVFLTAFIATMAAFASVHIQKRWKAYFIFFLFLEAAMLGVFMAQDLFLFFLFFEAALVPAFFMIGIWGYAQREKAAYKFLIYNGVGSAIMLIAFFIIVTTAGFSETMTSAGPVLSYSGDLQVIMTNLFHDANAMVHYVPEQSGTNPFFMSETMKWTLFIMLLIAFGIKLPIFPFHTWMLKVHAEASPGLVMLHSGVMLKMGAYGLIRYGVLLFPEQARDWAFVLAVLGVINILYGAVLAFVQRDFKMVLAYSSISHMGIVLLGIASFNETGMGGAVFQMVSHGLISALMFLIVGTLYERTQTTTLDELGGMAKSLPFTSGILLIGGMASLGLPGLSGFIAEFMAFLGLFGTHKIVTVVGTLGIILAAVYVLRAVLSITFGPMNEKYAGLRDARVTEAIPMVALVAFIVLLGVYPNIVLEPLTQGAFGFDQWVQLWNMEIGG